MKTAVFYENIHDGVRASGRRMEDALREFRDAADSVRWVKERLDK